MTGVPDAVRAGELCFVVGGADDLVQRAKPHLLKMSKEVFHMGPLGTGAVGKLIVNMLGGAETLIVHEAIQIGLAGGIPYPKALEMMRRIGHNSVLNRWQRTFDPSGDDPLPTIGQERFEQRHSAGCRAGAAIRPRRTDHSAIGCIGQVALSMPMKNATRSIVVVWRHRRRREKQKLKFSLFTEIQCPPGSSPAARLEEFMEQAELADRLGFHALLDRRDSLPAEIFAALRALCCARRGGADEPNGCASASRSTLCRCTIRCSLPKKRRCSIWSATAGWISPPAAVIRTAARMNASAPITSRLMTSWPSRSK